MKTIKCEICGGNNILKQDGAYVCQSCRTKYTVEEAKKMFADIDNFADETNSASFQFINTEEKQKKNVAIPISGKFRKNGVNAQRLKTLLSIFLVVSVIAIEILIVHPGIAVNTFYSIGVPFALVALLTPTTNPFTGQYKPTDYYAPSTDSLHIERITRASLMGVDDRITYDVYGKSELITQCGWFLLIWAVIILEIRLITKCYRTTKKPESIFCLFAITISVLIWAEIIYSIFGYVNAVVSFSVTFLLFFVTFEIFVREQNDK